jgi:hypothetical protein
MARFVFFIDFDATFGCLKVHTPPTLFPRCMLDPELRFLLFVIAPTRELVCSEAK